MTWPCPLTVERIWIGLTNPHKTQDSSPSDSDLETTLKWLDGSAYDSSVVGFKSDIGPFCHRFQNSVKAASCNATRRIVCQFDCLNINEGMVSGSLNVSSIRTALFQFTSVPTGYGSPRPGTFPYSENITKLTPTIPRTITRPSKSARRIMVPSWNTKQMMNLRLPRSC